MGNPAIGFTKTWFYLNMTAPENNNEIKCNNVNLTVALTLLLIVSCSALLVV